MMGTIGQLAWERWKIIGDVFGDFQARVIAVVFYFTLFMPFAIGARLFSDPLQLRQRNDQWLNRAPVSDSLEDAQRQF